jgi:hypothetical protein
MSNWLIMSDDGLWLFNTRRGGVIRIARQPAWSVAMSPDGEYVAYVTGNGAQQRDGLALYLWTGSSGESQKISDLVPSGREPDADTRTALEMGDSLAWSPDGSQLAFVAAPDDAPVALHLYSTEDGAISRLSNGSGHAYSPTWSPGGEHIVYQTASFFASGAGRALEGIWIARPGDGASARSLYPAPEGSHGEWIIGWRGNDTIVVQSLRERGQKFDLREVSIEGGAGRTLWSDEFTGSALDPESGAVLVTVGSDYTEEEQGIFLIRAGDKKTKRVADGPAYWTEWSAAAGLFVVNTDEGAAAISPRGEVREIPAPSGFVRVAQDGKRWASASSDPDKPGLLVGTFEGEVTEVFYDHVRTPSWGDNGQTLLFIGKVDASSLFIAMAPAFEATPIKNDLINALVVGS